MRIPFARFLVGAACLFVASVPAFAEEEISRPDVSILIARDPAVVAELELNERQIENVDEALADLDALVFGSRDDDSAAVARKMLQAVRKAEKRLHGGITAAQYRRLMNIVWQAQGYQALFEMDNARLLKITDEQEKDIREALKVAREKINELRSADAASDEPDPFIDQAIKRIDEEGEAQINALLTDKQRKQWAQLRGSPFDLSKVQPPAPRVPELAGITAWINSEPLTFADLRGKVVALHFWTFNDRHCAASYPAYRKWWADYADKGLVVLGVHTPEFPQEQDIDAVRAQAEINKLTFPIAIDNNAETWKAWANPSWPAVYLIDRQGCVRYWWYGVLNRPGAAGGDFLRTKIEEMLAW